jgi:hypothetical protein
MNFVLAARADNDTHRHADLDSGNVGIDNIGRNLWTFFQGNDRDNVREALLEVRVIRFVENDKGADCSST